MCYQVSSVMQGKHR
ncbi:unnamed protein product [Acanthoscelides obtectus]|uniref:Uncharacterized protein n=1 Tax=Acanthoscelides obtectus TaxID=200917 RepID=A0A9P0L0K8_ACAOB|nr:unnamed protein product [Acanthoscelides obtectus]